MNLAFLFVGRGFPSRGSDFIPANGSETLALHLGDKYYFLNYSSFYGIIY